MEKKLREFKGHTVIELYGDVDFYNIEELRKYLSKFVKRKTPSIVLDLTNIDYMDSSGIGLFVAVHKSMAAYNGKIGLLNVTKDVMDLLKLATIDTLIRIYKNEDEIEAVP